VRIGAAIIVRDMAPLVGAVVSCLSWTDGIYLFDDGSSDGSAQIANDFAGATPIFFERSTSNLCAFEEGQVKVRNYVIDRAFQETGCDTLMIVDADELVSNHLRGEIERIFLSKNFDSISLSMWHLYDLSSYLHFWEVVYSGVYLIDPHTRIIRKGRYFEDIFGDGNHPAIPATANTWFSHGPYHFHLKYFWKSPYPNYALAFLPRRLSPAAVAPYRRLLPFTLPDDIRDALQLIEWESLKEQDTVYYRAYAKRE